MLAELAQIHQQEDMVPIIAIIAGSIVGSIAIVFGMITSMSRRKQLERSRREIAAYIAEGSMTPEEGERLLNAGGEGGSKC